MSIYIYLVELGPFTQIRLKLYYKGGSLSSEYRHSYTRCVVDNGLEKIHTY